MLRLLSSAPMVLTRNRYEDEYALAMAVASELSPAKGRIPSLQRGAHHFCDRLAEEGFLCQQDEDIPIIDLGVGPSPHLAWHLLSRIFLGDLHFVDCAPAWLTCHRMVYEHLKAQRTHNSRELYERWYLGNIYERPHLLTGKKAIIHGELPRISEGYIPTPKDLIGALGGILDARPSQVALYLYAEERSYFERPSCVLPALDRLGVSYRRIDNVTSADFQPQPGGTLLLITP